MAAALRYPVAPVAGTEIIRIAPVPDVADVARLGVRKDGTSIYRPPGEERFVTRPHLDSEEWLVKRAEDPRPRLVTRERAEAALAGSDLDYQQREVVIGMLTSGVMAECLVAPAGTGKTHVMAAFARAWSRLTGGRVIGITLGENAARVMAEEGMTETYNAAKFLGKLKDSDKTRGHVPVYENDVLVLDEASQFSTADLVRIWQILDKTGARVKPVGDTEQLGPVEAGGMFRLLARRHGNWRLDEVRRFTESWEGPASLRLRDGDMLALGEYARHGRIYHGPANLMREEAVRLWLADYLRGKDSLLLAGSNEEAAELARMAREQLAERGRIDGRSMVTLADGNQAGAGDLVRARLNTKIDAGGQTLSNRDVIRITGWRGAGGDLAAVAERRLRDGSWSAPFTVPASYLAESAELGYAGNVFTSQGRTVNASYGLVNEAMTRDLAYVMATRGRERNVLFVPTGPPDGSVPSRQERDRAEAERLKAAAAHLERGEVDAALKAFELPPEPEPSPLAEPWEAVMAGILAKDDTLGTALEQVKAAQDFAVNIGHLITISEAFWWQDVAPQIDEQIRERLTPGEYARYLKDPERPALLQLIREHEIGGRPVAESLDMIAGRSMRGAHSIAAVLHGRLEKADPPARGRTQTFAERVPGGAAPEIAETYQAADATQAEIGRQLAARPEEWALNAWGVPPSAEESAARRADWEKQAGIVGAYRQAAGITDPKVAIGPVPAGKGILREMFGASIRALELADDQALLKAMGSGELEATLLQRQRAVAVAPPEVSARLASVERQRDVAVRQAEGAAEAGDHHLAGSAGALVKVHDGQLASLRVADAAHREWAEAHAPLEAQAQAAEQELRERGLAERAAGTRTRPTPLTRQELAAQMAEIVAEDQARRGPVAGPEPVAGQALAEADLEPWPAMSDTEFRQYLDRLVAEAEGREWTQPEPGPEAEPESQPEALSEAEFQEKIGRIVAESEGREYVPPEPAPEPEPRPEPLPEAEFRAKLDQIVRDSQRDREPEPEPEADDTAAMYAEVHEDLAAIGRGIRELAAQGEEAAAKRAEAYEENLRRPPAWQPQAQPSLEPSWQHGEAARHSEAEAEADFEAEI